MKKADTQIDGESCEGSLGDIVLDTQYAFTEFSHICDMILDALEALNHRDMPTFLRYAGHIGTLANYGVKLAKEQSDCMNILWHRLAKTDR